MKALIPALLLTVLPFTLGGCSYMGSLSSIQRMAYSKPVTNVPRPSENEALIYFIRKGRYEYQWALLSVIYDGDNFAAVVPCNVMFPYYASAGKHLFMAYADAGGAKPVVRFLEAEVREGRTYVVVISPSTFSPSGGFEMFPLHPRWILFEDHLKWMKKARIVDNNPKAGTWAEQNRDQILKTKAIYLEKWSKKPDENRIFLHPAAYLDYYLYPPEE